MKRNSSRYTTTAGRLFSVLTVCLALASCGGGGGGDGGGDQSAGVGGTGIVYGKATGFGSIFVNGVRYLTDGSRFVVDGDPNASQGDLSIGMVVRLEVRTANGKLTNEAIEVEYDDAVQGPVSATPVDVVGSGGAKKTFEVFGLTVTMDEVGTLFENTGFDTLAADDIVEISGFPTAADAITATFIEKKGTLADGSEIEIRGLISNYSAGPPQDFDIDGFSITEQPGVTEIDVPGGVLKSGLLVEVEGTITDTMTLAILADRIEAEDELFGDDEEDVSVQGIISNFAGIGDFEINGLKVDASGGGVEFEPAGAASSLGVGVEVEVEGEIIGGVLIADEVELREGESEVRSTIGTVDVGDSSFTVSYPVVGSVTVRVDNQTVFEDDTGAPVSPPFSLDDLLGGDFVRVEGREVNDEIIAGTVKRRNGDDDTLRLEGVVDDYVADDYITVLGIQYDLVIGTTSYEPSPPNIAIGDRVEIEDDNDPSGSADGFADKVEEEF